MTPGEYAEKAATNIINRIVNRDRETEEQWLNGQDQIAVAIQRAINNEREACAEIAEGHYIEPCCGEDIAMRIRRRT